MFKIVIFCISLYGASAYFTLPDKCPENVNLQEYFRLQDFYDTWYQAYHFASDGQQKNNCSTLKLLNTPTGIYLNQSRVDRGLFHRYSLGKLEIPSDIEKGSNLDITFTYQNAPRRIKNRRYPFHILATNYHHYATVYTCQYSPLINKHFIYVWILSRTPSLNEVSKTLAIKPLSQIGVDPETLVKDDNSNCAPKYYSDEETEPMTFRYPVPI
ncbi:apolipoprotein D-like isoform X1 [Plodia interpunctella]|uniref:apolipoprotein D-like isoform X1 n=1 Tax=Plodia interpunctella TaxID=58824 RepID=UPI002367F9F7|nr:apolipoprotein D-like isoform X1 [Plodia interpunctella]XP_053614017.1 apolipoprotein D-like isoform X1 [Plodia interpunctella]XP_053623524.1 apolipoprotein D-like isoform X1 [Plodia interpunctella]